MNIVERAIDGPKEQEGGDKYQVVGFAPGYYADVRIGKTHRSVSRERLLEQGE